MRLDPGRIRLAPGVAGGDGVADEAAQGSGCRLDRGEGEVLLLAVVGLEGEVPERQGVDAALDEDVDD